MITLGARDGWLAVLIGGWDFRYYYVPLDLNLAHEIIAAGTRFEEWLNEGTLPPFDGHDQTLKTVRKMHAGIEDRTVELDERAVINWRKARAAKLEAEEWERETNADLLAVLGSAKHGTVQGKKAVRRQATGGGAPPHLRDVK